MVTDNPGYAGSQSPKMKISLKDYPEIVLEFEIQVVISSCTIELIEDPTNIIVSPYNVIVGMPVNLDIAVPKFEPFPLCGYSADDVEYQVLDANGGSAGEWIEYDYSSQ